MKIGILTYHRSINYGAVTQCYALCRELQTRFPEDTVEVIDYVPKFRQKIYSPSVFRYLFPYYSGKRSLKSRARSLLARTRNLVFRSEEYRQQRKKYFAFQQSLLALPLSSKKLVSDSVQDFVRTYAEDYDVIVVGSDCVWEWSTVPFPNAYYLCGDFKAEKVTYAASLGTDSIELVPEEMQQRVAEAIRDFSYVGIRDFSTEYVVKKLDPQGINYRNCDPTTFLPADCLEEYRQRMRQRLKKAGIQHDKPIIGVMGNKKYFDLARRIFGDDVYYVGLYFFHPQCHLNLPDISVLEWASVFGLFDMTVTTFFHGTMLSLVNGTPVFSIDRLPENENQKTKLRELYQRLDLPGFYYRDQEEYSAEEITQMRALADELIQNPPKEKIARELAQDAKSSESFFEKLQQIKTNLENGGKQ